MANISSASGTLTLQGGWTQEALDAFLPVLDSWEFYGAYGLQWCGPVSLENPTADFYGSGRWSFTGTLESFDDWTRDWIKNGPDDTSHPLTQEQYDLFLTLMCEQDLSIFMEFDDEEEGCGVNEHETGVFTSDAESLFYEVLSCAENITEWKDLGKSAFDAAVDFFLDFLSEPDETAMRAWVMKNVTPTEAFENFAEYGDDGDYNDLFYSYSENVFSEELLNGFREKFRPDTEIWEGFLAFCESEAGFFQPGFWVGKNDDELEIDLEKGSIAFTVRSPYGVSSSWAWIKDHDDLKERFQWRDTFPYDIVHWHDVKQIAAGRDHVIRLKTDGSIVSADHFGFFDNSSWPGINTAVAAGWEHTAVLAEDGTVRLGGYGYFDQTDDVSEWTDITAVAAGAYHTVGLKADGSVVAAGNNQYGQCDTQDWTDIIAVAAGGALTAGIKKDGTVLLLPEGDPDLDVSGWTDIVAADAGEMYLAGLRSDGTVLVTGHIPEELKEEVSGWTDITAVAAGGWHLLGLKADGTVLAAGAADKGQCDVKDWSDIVSVAAGSALSFGIRSGGAVVSAGCYFNPNAEDEEEENTDEDDADDFRDEDGYWEDDWDED